MLTLYINQKDGAIIIRYFDIQSESNTMKKEKS